jgi:hypothetical protein
MGQARTLNKGWKIARGEILGKLSADDTLLPQASQRSRPRVAGQSACARRLPGFSAN